MSKYKRGEKVLSKKSTWNIPYTGECSKSEQNILNITGRANMYTGSYIPKCYWDDYNRLREQELTDMLCEQEYDDAEYLGEISKSITVYYCSGRIEFTSKDSSMISNLRLKISDNIVQLKNFLNIEIAILQDYTELSRCPMFLNLFFAEILGEKIEENYDNSITIPLSIFNCTLIGAKYFLGELSKLMFRIDAGLIETNMKKTELNFKEMSDIEKKYELTVIADSWGGKNIKKISTYRESMCYQIRRNLFGRLVYHNGLYRTNLRLNHIIIMLIFKFVTADDNDYDSDLSLSPNIKKVEIKLSTYEQHDTSVEWHADEGEIIRKNLMGEEYYAIPLSPLCRNEEQLKETLEQPFGLETSGGINFSRCERSELILDMEEPLPDKVTIDLYSVSSNIILTDSLGSRTIRYAC